MKERFFRIYLFHVRSWVQLALRANFVQLLQFHLFVQCPHFVSAIAFVSCHICLKQNLVQVITLVAEWIDTYGIHHWRIFWSSYRKLAWVGFEPTTTEFRSEALTDWAIRPWAQLALRANFEQLLQFHLFVKCSHFISAIAFVSRHICFKRNLAQVITLVAEITLVIYESLKNSKYNHIVPWKKKSPWFLRMCVCMYVHT